MRNSVYKRYINNHNHWWFQARKEIIKEKIAGKVTII